MKYEIKRYAPPVSKDNYKVCSSNNSRALDVVYFNSGEQSIDLVHVTSSRFISTYNEFVFTPIHIEIPVMADSILEFIAISDETVLTPKLYGITDSEFIDLSTGEIIYTFPTTTTTVDAQVISVPMVLVSTAYLVFSIDSGIYKVNNVYTAPSVSQIFSKNYTFRLMTTTDNIPVVIITDTDYEQPRFCTQLISYEREVDQIDGWCQTNGYDGIYCANQVVDTINNISYTLQISRNGYISFNWPNSVNGTIIRVGNSTSDIVRTMIDISGGIIIGDIPFENHIPIYINLYDILGDISYLNWKRVNPKFALREFSTSYSEYGFPHGLNLNTFVDIDGNFVVLLIYAEDYK